jgi:hypothetical protein
VWDRRLFLTSTGFDSVLGFDLERQRFDWGLQLTENDRGPRGGPFDPGGSNGPAPGNRLHLNMVSADARGLCLSGLRTTGLLHFDGKRIVRLVTLPEGSHNARPWRGGVLFNDTQADVVRHMSPEHNSVFQVPRYPQQTLLHTDLDDSRVARQGFARGLAILDDSRFASGSSPSTITVHDLDTMKTTLSINLSMDIRNAIHGLEVWPFE